VADSIRVKVVDSRIRQYGVGRDDFIEGLEISIEGNEATLQRFSIEHLNQDLLVSLGGQVIAEMKLRSILEPGPMDTLDWRHVGREDIGTLAQRLRLEGTPLVFKVKDRQPSRQR
jgi:hypothetical protein